MNHLILGGSGFIGSRLSKRLLKKESEIYILDKYISYEMRALSQVNKKLVLIELNLLESTKVCEILTKLIKDKEVIIWHFAANSDILKGIRDTSVDFRDTLGTTCSAIEISKILKTKSLIFASSSAIYGDRGNGVFSEKDTDYYPISNYGVMKLASEFLLKSNCYNFNTPTLILRFPNVIGWPTTHGVIFDFYNKLKSTERTLDVLGDGFQTKPYIHIEELIDIMEILSVDTYEFEVFNISPDDEGISVREIAEALVKKIGRQVEINYQQTSYGWIGDVPKYRFDVSKLKKKFKNLNLSSRGAIEKTLREIG